MKILIAMFFCQCFQLFPVCTVTFLFRKINII